MVEEREVVMGGTDDVGRQRIHTETILLRNKNVSRDAYDRTRAHMQTHPLGARCQGTNPTGGDREGEGDK